MDIVFSKCARSATFDELQRGLEPFVHWHVTESIQESYNPEAIGELQEELEVEALVLERISISRDHALGYFVSLVHHYLAQQSDLANVDAAIDALHADLEKDKKYAAPFSDFHLDTTEIYAYVEEQRKSNGLVADDPDWHPERGVEFKQQWNAVFKRSLEKTRMAYVEACKRFEHRFKQGTEADLALIQLRSRDELAKLASQYKASPRHVPASPAVAATESSFWSKRTEHKRQAGSKILPDFDHARLIQAGQQVRSSCIDGMRDHPSDHGKNVEVILSQALNLETSPEKLIDRAKQQYTPFTASSKAKLGATDEELILRRVKDWLSSALRILGTRDGQRNVDLRIDALNLRGHVHHRLAALKPPHEASYLSRAVADWSASAELDASQRDIIGVLAETGIRLESFSKAIAATSDKEFSSADTTLSKKMSKSSLNSQPTPPVSTKPLPVASTSAKSKHEPAPAASSSTRDTTPTSPSKPREKTILESPFFRPDLVTGLMVDTLLALPFPHKALRETLRFPSAAALSAAAQDPVPTLDRLAKSHQQTTKSLTPENKAQVTAAVKAVSAVLALPDMQARKEEGREKVLRRTSLRLVLGSLWLMQGGLVKAQTELELVSDALRPNPRKTLPMSDAEPADEEVMRMQTRVQGQTLLLLAKTCWMGNKVQEAIKFFRWFTRWCSEQQAERVADAKEDAEGDAGEEEPGKAAVIELDELDMSWWDRVVVVTKG